MRGTSDRPTGSPADSERDALLREALAARAQAEAAQAHSEIALRDAEDARRIADEANARQAVLARAGRAMAASMDYRGTLAEVAEEAAGVLADWCMFTTVSSEGSIEPLALAHSDRGKRERLMELMRRHPPRLGAEVGAAKVIRTGEPELLPTIEVDTLMRSAFGDEAKLEMLRALGLRTVLTVPLKTPTRILGAMSLVRESDRPFTRDDMETAVSLSARVGLYLQNARLYAERSHIAETLQRSLLPARLPEVPGAELAVRYRAAGEEFEVGGDFYDVFGTCSEEWIAFVGDVCGKGAEAAALTSLMRHTLFAEALRGGDPLSSVRLANDALRARSPDMRFATLAHVRLRPRAGGGLDVRLTNAGHPPPLVLRADGTVEETHASGMPVGIVPDPEFDQQDFALAPGELLLLYTDGVTELRRRRSATDVGELALRETLRWRANCDPQSVVEAIERRAVELQDGRPRDDIAVMAIRARD